MVSDPPQTALPRQVMRLWMLESWAGGLCVGVVAYLVGWVWRPTPLVTLLMAVLGGVALGAAFMETLVLIRLRYLTYRYRADADALVVHCGYALSTCMVVPAAQILYVDVRQGPFARRLGLGTVHVGTLGSEHSVGPVEEAEAQRILAVYGSGRPHATQ